MKRCMGCMESIEDGLAICPLCGYAFGTPPKEAYHMPPESILAARYIVGKVLGFGGFGVTYIGWDAQLERKIAIKEFLPSCFATRMPGYTEITVYGGEATLQFEAGLSRFTEEAKRLAAFNSIPGIVDIYDTFVENNTAYIVMEYLQGEDVKAMLAQKGTFSFEEALPIIVSVCDTLQPVHQAGIIHRDIAPDNIYITKEGEIKLLDFGASRFATSVNSKSLSVILKSGYAPEEQYRSKGDQGSWSDVYSLAATFYKMLTGITPPDAMERTIKDELKPPSQLGAAIPTDVENAILNALNIRKENRIQTAEMFKKAITGGRVERIREKAVKSDSGAFPTWGKAAVIGSLSAALLFGLFTVTGVINFGQGNLLADTFGSGIPKGQTNTPGIINMLEDAAKETVQKAGLDYLITGTQYSDDIEKGKILSQEPLPGRLIDLGDEIQVHISGGSAEEAQAAGEMELVDLTYMNIAQAAAEMNRFGKGAAIRYEYSDTVAEGLVMEYSEEETYVGLIVSAGQNQGQKPEGEIRAPYIFKSNYDELKLIYTIASTEADDTPVYHEYSYSADEGETWIKIEDEAEANPYTDVYYYMDKSIEVLTLEVSLEDFFIYRMEELAGSKLMFKVERWKEKEDRSGEPIDSAVFPQTVTASMEETPFRITGAGEISWEEVEERLQDETGNEGLKELTKMAPEGLIDYFIIYQIKGNFTEGKSYKLNYMPMYGIVNNPPIPCLEDGSIYFYKMKDGLDIDAGLGFVDTITEFIVWADSKIEVSGQGDISIKLAPAYCRVQEDGSVMQ